MEKNNEVIEVENQVSTELNIDSVIMQVALQPDGIERLSKLMDLRDRDNEFKAKKSFDKAMSEFQSDCPVIKKSKVGAKTNSGAVKFKYADLGMIVSQVKETLSKHGLSYTMKTEILKDGNVKSTCIAKHFEGGKDESSLVVPVTTVASNIMTPTQSMASATTFAKRYAFCDVFGILTADEDEHDKVNYAEVEEQKDPKFIAKINELKNMTQLTNFYNACKPDQQEKYKDDFTVKKESFRTPKSSEVPDSEIPEIGINK